MNVVNRFTALVLAGDRHPGDAVAAAAGVPCKALAPVAGVPMVLRVVRALEDSGAVARIILIGPPELESCASLAELLNSGRVERMASLGGPSASTAAALAALESATPVLLTTADHALLQGDIVADFLQDVTETGGDVAVGVVDYQMLRRYLPAVKRTITRLADGDYCGCNLFAFQTPRGRTLAEFWAQVERSRKRPSRLIVQLLGLRGLLAYAIGRLTLASALERLSKRTGVDIRAINVAAPTAAIDVDSVADYQLAERLSR